MFSTKIITPVIVTLTLIIGIILFDLFGILGFALIPLAFGLMMVLSRPVIALLIFWIITLFTPVAELIIPPLVTKITEQSMGLLILAIFLADLFINKRMPERTRRFTLLLGLLLFILGVSAVANGIAVISFGFYMITYFKHFWIFYFGVRYLGKKHIRLVTCMIIASALLQIVFNCAYYLGHNPLPYYAYRSFHDAAIGTLASCNFVAYMLIFFICFLFSFLKRATGLAEILILLTMLAAALLQFHYTYTLHAYPVLFGAIILQFIIHISTDRKHNMRKAPVILIFCVTLIILGIWAHKDPFIRRVAGLNKLYSNYDLVVYGLKGDAYNKVFCHAEDFLKYPLLGGGPGNYTSHIARITERPLAQLGHMAYRDFAQDQVSVTMGGSALTMPHTGFIAIWGELGPFGFFLYWGIYIYAIMRVFRQISRDEYSNKYQSILAESIIPSIAAFVVLNLILDLIAILPLNLGLWIWISTVWNPLPDDNVPESENHHVNLRTPQHDK